MWGKFNALYRELGGGPMADYLLRRLLAVLGLSFHRYRLVVQPVPEKSWLPERHRAAFDIRPVGRDDYQLDWFPRPAEVIRQRFEQGALCWVAFKDGDAVGCQWLLPGPYLEDEVRCRFLPLPARRVAWDFDVYVVPEMRLGRLFLLLWDTVNAWMREQGIVCTASRIDSLNLQSIRSHQRMGASTVGTAWFLSAGGWQLARWPGGWQLSGDPERMPEIKVSAESPE